MIALLAGAALAGTVAVTTVVEGEYASASTVQSAAWHALVGRDHEPVLLARDLVHAPERMREAGASVLLDVHVRWHVDPRPTEDGLLPAPFPELAITEYHLGEAGLAPVRTWTQVEPPVVENDPALGWYSLPDRSLQRAIASALLPFRAPAPVEAAPVPRSDLLPLPIVVAADEEYRARYGERWREVALERIERASALVRPAGFRLEVARWQAWTSPDAEQSLERLLGALEATPQDEALLRVGLTGQLDLTRDGGAEDVGLAYSPGANVLVGDLQLPGLDPTWDVAEEGVVIAHELLHALGVPHAKHPNLLMSESKQSAVHVVSEGTRELARAAVQARRAHWDPVAALHALAYAAQVRLTTPESQVAYILDNLAAGPGIPSPGTVRPETSSALVNVAMARYYLERSHALPQQARALRQGALAHGLAALSEAPALAGPLLAHLTPEDPTVATVPEPAAEDLARCVDAVWALAHCPRP